MADPNLQTELLCPRCQTPNQPHALRCRQCFSDLGGLRVPVFAERPRQLAHCASCGRANAFGAEACVECGEALSAPAATALPGEPAASAALPETSPRARRQAPRRRSLKLPAGVTLPLLVRVAAVAYLFWGLYDTSAWLDRVTTTLAPADPAALRYNLYAIFELARHAGIVLGVWLLTMLRPARRA